MKNLTEVCEAAHKESEFMRTIAEACLCAVRTGVRPDFIVATLEMNTNTIKSAIQLEPFTK